MINDKDAFFMAKALSLAENAYATDEVPVGAIVVRDDAIIGQGWNMPIATCDPSAHAEIVAIRDATKTESNYRIPNTCLYVTIEPCTMCLGAIIHARVERIVFGALEPKAGVLQSNPNEMTFNHAFTWSGGVMQDECSDLIHRFFSERRERKKQLRALGKKDENQ